MSAFTRVHLEVAGFIRVRLFARVGVSVLIWVRVGSLWRTGHFAEFIRFHVVSLVHALGSRGFTRCRWIVSGLRVITRVRGGVYGLIWIGVGSHGRA